MLKIIQILFFFISITAFSQKVLDVVYLNNGSIIKGTIVKIVPNKDVKLTTDNGSVFIFKMSDIKEITKETEEAINKELEKEAENELVIDNQANFNNDNHTVDENHGDDYVFEEKPKKKKKSKFWKSLGNFAVKVLDNAAENANNNTNETSTDNNPEIDNTSEEIYQDENSTREEEPIAMKSVGTICFVNPNFYSRKVKLTKRNAYDTKQMLIGGSDKSCNYDLPVGVYSCKVYTTYTGKLIESFSLRIVDGEEASRRLNKNEFN